MRSVAIRKAVVVVAMLCFACTRNSLAQISPGELSRFHAKLEGLSNCTSCHELRKEVTSDKCLACHTALRNRIDKTLGYHAGADIVGRACRECHSEHNGRDYELIHWREGRDRFDHRQTGFELRGAHARQNCRSCHRAAWVGSETHADANVNPERTFLGLNPACTHCHADEHREQLPDHCETCHSFDGWSPAPGFSHGQARYPLTGKHAQVACTKCHPFLPAPPEPQETRLSKSERIGTYSQYTGLEFGSCADCHEDAHRGKFGTGCSKCHSTEGFRDIAQAQFDHSRTAFPLLGRHAQVECAHCHRSGKMTDRIAHERCADCHHDVHEGQFAHRQSGGACEECHTTDGFTPALFTLEQHGSTRYALTGSHQAIPCFACHAPDSIQQSKIRFRFTDLSCRGCHADPHEGQLDHWISKSGCEFCHSTDTWRQTSFDHALAKFPLQGKHREILCLKCHTVVRPETGTETLWIKPLTMDCAGCHSDIHFGQFASNDGSGATCERCHTPDGWKELVFVHNRDARFSLDGAHERLSCSECHKPTEHSSGANYVVYRPLETACADCHGSKP